MSRFHFTIAGALLVTTLAAFGLAALVSQSVLAGSAAYTLFVGLIGLATAGAIVRPLPARAFWLGMTLFGWIYWHTEFEIEVRPRGGGFAGGGAAFYVATLTGASSSEPASPSLITRQLLQIVVDSQSAQRTVGSRVMGQWRGGTYYHGTISEMKGDEYLIVWDDGSAPQWTPASGILPDSPTVLVAGHSLFGGLFALVGGVLSAVIFGRTSRAEKQPSAANSQA
jgi:hypothetical protein